MTTPRNRAELRDAIARILMDPLTPDLDATVARAAADRILSLLPNEAGLTGAGMVCIPLDLAQLIDRVFLPLNPNKMRKADPSVPAAAHAFRAAVRAATPYAPEQEQPK